MIVTYKAAQLRDIDALIKQWLPYVKVIEPQELKDQIPNELKAYIDSTLS